jgi:hypothetical protein
MVMSSATEPVERHDFSSNHHPALPLCLSMVFFRKPVPTFRDHALCDATAWITYMPGERRAEESPGNSHCVPREIHDPNFDPREKAPLERDDVSSNHHPALPLCLSMIFSENRFPLFGIML